MSAFIAPSLLALLIAGSAPAIAAEQTKPVTDPKQKVICQEQTTVGSRLGGRKVCHTALEWDRINHEDRDDVEKAQRLAKMPGQ